MGRIFKDKNPNRQIIADGASTDADMSRCWIGTTWPKIPNNIIPQTEMSLCPAWSRPWARRMKLYDRLPANKIRGNWEQEVERSDRRAI